MILNVTKSYNGLFSRPVLNFFFSSFLLSVMLSIYENNTMTENYRGMRGEPFIPELYRRCTRLSLQVKNSFECRILTTEANLTDFLKSGVYEIITSWNSQIPESNLQSAVDQYSFFVFDFEFVPNFRGISKFLGAPWWVLWETNLTLAPLFVILSYWRNRAADTLLYSRHRIPWSKVIWLTCVACEAKATERIPLCRQAPLFLHEQEHWSLFLVNST